MSEYICNRTNIELYHHGIKGQKWGVRRYQYPDGTLTEQGKARYLTDNGDLNDEGRDVYSILYNEAQGYSAERNRLDKRAKKIESKADKLKQDSVNRFKKIDWGNVGKYESIKAAKKYAKAEKIFDKVRKMDAKIDKIKSDPIYKIGEKQIDKLLKEANKIGTEEAMERYLDEVHDIRDRALYG